jgi:methylated-DNA-protein-cysteine methyltransferase-like protein
VKRTTSSSPFAFDAFDAIYAAVMKIPVGRVATYGQIAGEAGLPRRARLVGYALGSLPQESDVPWHRVVNARGEISPRGASEGEREQRRLLEAEGVAFTDAGRIDLRRFRWNPEEG